jgi:dTMP kinase
MNRTGRFIVIEGTDGSGTTTQTELLVQALGRIGIAAHPTREPTAGPVGRLLREALEKRLMRDAKRQATLDWTTFALLFAADRTDHIRDEVLPLLAQGTWVVSDRYDLSSLIYQSLTAPDPDAALEWVRQVNAQALRPDLVVVLDVDAETAAARRRARGGPEELFESRELQARLAAAYLDAERFAPFEPLAHLDGTTAFTEVAARVFDFVRSQMRV